MPEHHHDWTGRRALVTGGAGFIGTHLVNRLVAVGCEVRVLDDLSTGRPRWTNAPAELIEGCVRSRATFEQAAADCEVVFHLAAMVSAPECEALADRCHAINVEATGIAAKVATQYDATLVFASSCAVYGDSPSRPCDESTPTRPISVYGDSKAQAERVIEAEVATRRLPATSLRFFNVVGGGQRPDVPYAAAVPIFATALLDGKVLQIHGDGLQTRDFLPVELAVEAMLRAANMPCNQPVNVATGRETSLLELIGMLSAITGREAEWVHTEPRPADIRHSVGDTRLLESRLGLPSQLGSRDVLLQALASVVELIPAKRSLPPCG